MGGIVDTISNHRHDRPCRTGRFLAAEPTGLGGFLQGLLEISDLLGLFLGEHACDDIVGGNSDNLTNRDCGRGIVSGDHPNINTPIAEGLQNTQDLESDGVGDRQHD